MNTDKIYAEKIAEEYAPKEASKIVALKKLDRKAKRGAESFAYSFGTFFTLVFGTGMCYSMGTIGNGGSMDMAVGIALGIIGITAMTANYPIYKKLLQRGKQKYGSDILRLAREISEE